MGLDINSTKLEIYAKSLNVDFTKTAMIGRQRLRLRPYDLRKNIYSRRCLLMKKQ